jgi:Ca-activated chloride channel family protein
MRSDSTFPDWRAACVAVAVVLSAGLVAAQVASPPPAVYKAGTDLVALQVSVSDGQRRYVTGLQAENFTVFDEGVAQPIAVFATSDAPLDLMLLMDTSGSMDVRLAFARNAATGLVRGLRSGDRAGLILFDTGAVIGHQLSDQREAVMTAIQRVSPGGATALYDAVYLGLHTLSRARRQEEGPRRQALVVLSDGQDNSSHIPFEQALDAARTGDVTIFTIMPGLAAADPAAALVDRALDARVRFEMRRLAEDTGGRLFVTTDAGLADVYAQIGGELRAQYWLGYAAAASRSGFHRVSVRVKEPPGLLARTRSGYNAGRSVAAINHSGEGTVATVPHDVRLVR